MFPTGIQPDWEGLDVSAESDGQALAPHHDHMHAELEAHDLRYKGLRKGSVSLVAAVAIGLAATAPAYSLTGALGYGALESGYQLPIVFVISVIPMFFVALAYKHMTTVAADSGTVFTWGSMAIGPRTGWIGGWGLFLSSTLAGVGAAEVMVNSVVTVAGLEEPPLLMRMAIGTVFILITTALVARGAQESSRTTLGLTVIQYGGLILFATILFLAIFGGETAPTAEPFSWQWLNPMAIDGYGAMLGGFLVALFIFWGFDASLAMSEESEGNSAQAGRTGVISMMIILVTYVIFTIAALAFSGIDESDPMSLTNEENIDDVFLVMATESIGEWGAVVAALIVGLSAFSATMSTVMPTARGVLAMATYKALPSRFASIDEATAAPKVATWFMGLLTLAIYLGLSLTSDAIVQDSVYSVGISICVYYIVAALASVLYFHRTAFSSLRTALAQVILPAVAVVVLVYVLIVEARNMMDPDYGSGSSVQGVGTVFIVGVLGMLLAIPLMVAWNMKSPGFFRNETLPKQRAHWVEDAGK
jgi:amino acid transporter